MSETIRNGVPGENFFQPQPVEGVAFQPEPSKPVSRMEVIGFETAQQQIQSHVERTGHNGLRAVRLIGPEAIKFGVDRPTVLYDLADTQPTRRS